MKSAFQILITGFCEKYTMAKKTTISNLRIRNRNSKRNTEETKNIESWCFVDEAILLRCDTLRMRETENEREKKQQRIQIVCSACGFCCCCHCCVYYGCCCSHFECISHWALVRVYVHMNESYTFWLGVYVYATVCNDDRARV